MKKNIVVKLSLAFICSILVISEGKIVNAIDILDNKDSQEHSYNEYDELVITEVKMKEYKETYIQMYGSDEGFNEDEIYAESKHLQELNEGTMFNVNSRANIIKGKYFNWIKWINRDGLISLSISPTKNFLNITSKSAYAAAVTESWGIIKRNHSGDKRWKNTKSMEMQYKCHAYLVKFKNPWNIEPCRTETDYNKVVLGKCNPKKGC
ncbi:DUF2599 domain-containing protein [Metaclostridioides mangenotii]|uniref:Uncharacterized protein n=1 Tax=Metaclostridioides mangenotii TaxID=1540 RepID=A0ABS4E6Z1_9FIRM|nr:DUF2599 domain-containing protein [Clostridioides mangenotii]MBP1853706.1 hypothetical protein [Clostridioides mangenotii]